MMFTNLNAFSGFWQRESDTTRRVLAALTDKGLGYKPDKKSRSAAELAWHLVTSPRWFAGDQMKLSLNDGFDKAWPKPPSKAADFLKAFDQTHQTCLSAFQAKGDAWLGQTSDFLGQAMPNGGILLVMMFHETHHRGQLSAYLRPMGSKVPSIYGPSADSDGGHEPAPKAKPKGKAKSKTAAH